LFFAAVALSLALDLHVFASDGSDGGGALVAPGSRAAGQSRQVLQLPATRGSRLLPT